MLPRTPVQTPVRPAARPLTRPAAQPAAPEPVREPVPEPVQEVLEMAPVAPYRVVGEVLDTYIVIEQEGAVLLKSDYGPEGKPVLPLEEPTSTNKTKVNVFGWAGCDSGFVVQGTGSGTGRQNAANGTYDIGFASAEVTEEDMNAENPIGDFEIYQLCADGIAIIVNTENTVSGVTTAQLKDIYTGVVTDWSEIE